MSHVLDVDQHVRYALVLQAGLGTTLAILLGYLPGGGGTAVLVALVAVVWLIFVEVVHRLRESSVAARLALFDRGIRYLLMALLIGFWAVAIGGFFDVQAWLAWKLLCFAGVLVCGVGIRIQIIAFYRVWRELEKQGPSAGREQAIQKIYARATSILVGLWMFIAVMVVISVWKPTL